MSAGDVRAFLARHGLLARRDLGQNFLTDAGLAERLVGLAGVEPGDSVLEVGTGLGILTRALAGRAARVVTLDVDAGLVRALRDESLLPANVELMHADVLEVDLASIAGALPPPVRLVANLPYSISAPALRRILDLRSVLVDWSVMLQREVAQRLLAAPGSKSYGSLGALHRLVLSLSRETELSPGCFWPVPRVRSSFVRMTPLSPPLLADDELARVEVVVRAAFAKRRKTIRNSLRGAGLADDSVLDAALAVIF